MCQRICKYSFFLLIWGGFAFGQQQPLFTQYMFNGLILNPAYAGSQETMHASAVFRRQWIGIEDAPQTETLSLHSRLDKLRPGHKVGSPVSLGVTLFSDRIAITGETGLLGSYAYRLEFSSGAYLSLGLQGGFSQLRIRYSQLQLDDPAFALGDISEWQPEFGAGIYYQTPKFYAGLSAPRMLRQSAALAGAATTLAPHYFLTTGYLFDVGHSLKLKPNLLLKQYGVNLWQLDLNCNLFIREIVNIGLSWRSSESVSTLLQYQVAERFGVGYAYDVPITGQLGRVNNGSHEFLVTYRIPEVKVRAINPRFF